MQNMMARVHQLEAEAKPALTGENASPTADCSKEYVCIHNHQRPSHYTYFTTVVGGRRLYATEAAPAASKSGKLVLNLVAPHTVRKLLYYCNEGISILHSCITRAAPRPYLNRLKLSG